MAKAILPKSKCCLCGKEFRGYGNNPSPLSNEGVCCDKCNLDKVIPERSGRIPEEVMEELRARLQDLKEIYQV